MITPDSDTIDLYSLYALAANLTINAPSGTPTNGQKLMIRIKDNGTPRTITWNSAFADGGAGLPTTTTANKIMHVGFQYNTDSGLNKWQSISFIEEP